MLSGCVRATLKLRGPGGILRHGRSGSIARQSGESRAAPPLTGAQRGEAGVGRPPVTDGVRVCAHSEVQEIFSSEV